MMNFGDRPDNATEVMQNLSFSSYSNGGSEQVPIHYSNNANEASLYENMCCKYDESRTKDQ